jgi:hypothetical protein
VEKQTYRAVVENSKVIEDLARTKVPLQALVRRPDTPLSVDFKIVAGSYLKVGQNGHDG